MTLSTSQVRPVASLLLAPNPALPMSEAPQETAVPTSSEATPEAALEATVATLSFNLPGALAKVFRAGAGDELSDFASYALTRFLLREHWVELEDCPLLPFLLQMTNDVVDYQLAPDAATAVAQAEAVGDETVLQVELDLGLTVVEVEAEGTEDF